jgi:hypothetical protein
MPLRNRFHRGTERAVVRFPARLEVDRLCLHLLPVIALALISNASAEFTVDELRQQAAETFQRARERLQTMFLWTRYVSLPQVIVKSE